MAQALSSPQRYRGFILTDTGLLKLHERIKQLEAKTRLRQSPRTIAEQVQLNEPEGIHPITVRKILSGQSSVDKRSIQLVFQVLQLQLEVGDCAHAGLCQSVEAASAPELPVPPPHAWGEPIKDGSLYGREPELAQLNQAIVTQHYRLVQILGTAGIGKTALAAHLTKTVQPEFDCVIWKSLQHAPAIQPSLTGILQALGQSTGAQLPTSVEALLGLLIEQLQQHRCLLVFDHFNSLLDSKQHAGYCRSEHEAYYELLRLVAEVPHQSCLMITSREQPRVIGIGEEHYLSLQLSGLLTSAQQQIARAYPQLVGSTDDWQLLINRYHGHPLALKIVAGYVQNYFDHQIPDYLNHLQRGQLLFGDLRDLLAQQFNRLAPVEQELACRLAQYSAPISISQFREDLTSIYQQYLFEALESLSRRSLLHRQGTEISLDWMLKAYVNECLVEQRDNAVPKSKLKIIYNKDSAQATESLCVFAAIR